MKTKSITALVCLGAAVLSFAGVELSSAQQWAPLSTGVTEDLFGIWGTSKNNLFIAGDSGIYNGSGNTWNAVMTGVRQRCVWGFSPADIFAVGDGGSINHFNGVAWSSMPGGASDDLYGVWGPAPNQVYAVGDSGRILYYDGTAWVTQASGTVENLQSIWGNDGSDIYVVGENGVILHFDGRSWSAMKSPTTQNLHVVWGCGCFNIYAAGAGGTLLRYNRKTWQQAPSGTDQELFGMWDITEEDIFVVGAQGTIVHYDGLWTDTLMDSGTTHTINHLWGFAEDNLYAVGDDGILLHYSSDSIDNETCKLQVYPSKINAFFNMLFPFHVMLFVGDTDAHFTRTDAGGAAWDTAAITAFLNIKFGSRLIISLVFINPSIESGYYEITVGTCAGMLQVQQPFSPGRSEQKTRSRCNNPTTPY